MLNYEELRESERQRAEKAFLVLMAEFEEVIAAYAALFECEFEDITVREVIGFLIENLLDQEDRSQLLEDLQD